MNREWHQQHTMPRNPTPRQRIAWHMAHAAHCSCRPFPRGLLSQLTPQQQRQLAEAKQQTDHAPLR